MRISGDGGTIRSLGIAGQAVGGIDEVEQPAISNALSGIRIFDAVTINHLFLDYFDSKVLLLYIQDILFITDVNICNIDNLANSQICEYK